jgi:hypothetical protein
VCTYTPDFRTARVGVRRFAADAKYSSLHERTLAPRAVVLRFVAVEKVASINEEGTMVTLGNGGGGTGSLGGTSVSWIISRLRAWTSIVPVRSERQSRYEGTRTSLYINDI